MLMISVGGGGGGGGTAAWGICYIVRPAILGYVIVLGLAISSHFSATTVFDMGHVRTSSQLLTLPMLRILLSKAHG